MTSDKPNLAYLYVIVHVANIRIPIIVNEDMSCQAVINAVKRRLTYFRRGLFGLQYEDNKHTMQWVAMNQSVMDLFARHSKVASVYLRPNRFPKINWNSCDAATAKLFYHHLRKIVAIGSIDMTLNVAVNLKAIEMQSQYGNRNPAIRSRGQYLCFGSPPSQLVGSEPVSNMKWKRLVYNAWEDKTDMPFEQAIHKYMSIVDKLPKYGILYFQVWNESAKEKYLGISVSAIRIYDSQDTAFCEIEIRWGDVSEVRRSGKRVTIYRRAPRKEKLVYFTDRQKTAAQIAILSRDYREVDELELSSQRLQHQLPRRQAVGQAKPKSIGGLLLHAVGIGNGSAEKCPKAVCKLERVYIAPFEMHKAKAGHVVCINDQVFFKSQVCTTVIAE
uniref:FERM domain-containing protein n=1 Tax=Trichuris muris TaxID=70415 RepID=A0A5S6R446_TRIMR